MMRVNMTLWAVQKSELFLNFRHDLYPDLPDRLPGMLIDRYLCHGSRGWRAGRSQRGYWMLHVTILMRLMVTMLLRRLIGLCEYGWWVRWYRSTRKISAAMRMSISRLYPAMTWMVTFPRSQGHLGCGCSSLWAGRSTHSLSSSTLIPHRDSSTALPCSNRYPIHRLSRFDYPPPSHLIPSVNHRRVIPRSDLLTGN